MRIPPLLGFVLVMGSFWALAVGMMWSFLHAWRAGQGHPVAAEQSWKRP